MIYAAFYKKKRPVDSLVTAWYRLADEITRLVTRGIYSHCEIAIKEGDEYRCYSASIRDGGVRSKLMPLDPDDWDLVDISGAVSAQQIVDFYIKTAGSKYDFIGLLSPVVGQWHDTNKYFCSEWCAEALGITRPYKISPASLYPIAAGLV